MIYEATIIETAHISVRFRAPPDLPEEELKRRAYLAWMGRPKEGDTVESIDCASDGYAVQSVVQRD